METFRCAARGGVASCSHPTSLHFPRPASLRSSAWRGDSTWSARPVQTSASASTVQPAATPPLSTPAGDEGPDHSRASPKLEAQLTLEQYKEIYDRLIKVFSERPRDDWKKLIVFSKQWPQHVDGVFARIKEMSDKEADADKKMKLRNTFRSLKGVHEEILRYNSVLAKFTAAGDDEWDAIVAVNRGELQAGFFEHMQCLLVAVKDNVEQRERLVMTNTRLVALCAFHDSIAGDPEALERAAEVYRDLLGSIKSVEDMDEKMAKLGAAGKIDPAFLAISARAYGAARDTNMTLEESKWVSYKLYRHAKDYFDRKQPTEKRIIEYLMTMTDPAERSRQLDAAVTPGPAPWTDTHDYMYTTPDRLFLILDNCLKAYSAMQQQAEVALNTPEHAMMPRKVRVMRELRDELMRRYL